MKRMAILVGVLCLSTVGLAGQDPPEGSHGQEGTPGMDEVMAAWAKYAVPGEQHAKLKALEGKFVAKAKFRMAPDQPWVESVSDVEGSWVLGGRFLKQTVHSEPDAMMPAGFEGLGFFGYDNYQQKYVMVWMDTMSTQALTAHGAADGDRIAFKGTYMDPMSGAEKVFKWVYETGGDAVTQQMYEQGPDGEMFVGAELVYERK